MGLRILVLTLRLVEEERLYIDFASFSFLFCRKVWVKNRMKTCNNHGGVCFLTAFSSVLCIATFNRD